MTMDEFKEKFMPDQEAQNAVWAHSCSQWNKENIEDMVFGTLKAVEVCCTRPQDPMQFGNMGVLIKGRVTAMFREDMGSQIKADGERWITIKPEKSKYYKELMELTVSHYQELTPYDPDGYTESWVIPAEIVGVFVTRSFYERAQKDDLDAEDLKEFVGDYPLTIIEN